MKRIYIYLADDGEAYTDGAIAELADKPNGDVFAFVSSPNINKLWRAFEREVASHPMNKDAVFHPGTVEGGGSSTCLFGDLEMALYKNERVPFVCYHKITRAKWSCTERCVVGAETVQEAMR